jgi:hypothetical protein
MRIMLVKLRRRPTRGRPKRRNLLKRDAVAENLVKTEVLRDVVKITNKIELAHPFG